MPVNDDRKPWRVMSVFDPFSFRFQRLRKRFHRDFFSFLADPTASGLISQEAEEDQERADLSEQRFCWASWIDSKLLPPPAGLTEDHRPLNKRGNRGNAWGSAIAVSLVVVIFSIGTYSFLQWRTINRLVGIQTDRAAQLPDPREMVARLEARLRENPDDVQGQMLAGRSYMALDRVDDAKKAYEKVLELDPRNHEAHYNMGVIMIEERKFDDPKLFEAALKHFEVVLIDRPKRTRGELV